MDYIFKDWEEKLSNFESSVEKDLAEIRKCKAEMQQMKLDVVAELQKGRYVRDTQRLVLSAPTQSIEKSSPFQFRLALMLQVISGLSV